MHFMPLAGRETLIFYFWFRVHRTQNCPYAMTRHSLFKLTYFTSPSLLSRLQTFLHRYFLRMGRPAGVGGIYPCGMLPSNSPSTFLFTSFSSDKQISWSPGGKKELHCVSFIGPSKQGLAGSSGTLEDRVASSVCG